MRVWSTLATAGFKNARSDSVGGDNYLPYEIVGRVASADVRDAVEAIHAASRAYPAWRALGVEKRSELLKQLAARMRERLAHRGEPAAEVVIVQGSGKDTLRLFGAPYSVNRVRTAMFNAAVRWAPFEID